jgi:hypothetical protein
MRIEKFDLSVFDSLLVRVFVVASFFATNCVMFDVVINML